MELLAEGVLFRGDGLEFFGYGRPALRNAAVIIQNFSDSPKVLLDFSAGLAFPLCDGGLAAFDEVFLALEVPAGRKGPAGSPSATGLKGARKTSHTVTARPGGRDTDPESEMMARLMRPLTKGSPCWSQSKMLGVTARTRSKR